MADRVPPRVPTAWRANERDNGKWRKGCVGGPGRPRKLDLLQLCRDHSALEGTTIEQSLWVVVSKMLELARAGDFGVGRYLIDRLTEGDEEAKAKLGIAVGQGGQVAIQVVTGVPRTDDDDAPSNDGPRLLPVPEYDESRDPNASSLLD